MKKFWKVLKTVLKVLILLILGLGFGVVLFLSPKIKTLYVEASDKVNSIKEDTFKSAQTSLVYDANNNIIAKLKGEKDSYYLTFDEIPENVKYLFIATEDKSFLTHKGIDIKGIGRAAVNLIKNREISGGGSTITQQLARNVFLSHETSFERKIKEIFISILLEQRYSKEELLEFYINSIYFANGKYGIEAASKKYFNKSVSELTLSQTAFLCAIPNNPTLYNPLTKFDNTIKRRDRMLGYMLEDGYITQKEYDEAVKEKIVLELEKSIKNNYVDTYVINCATETLMELKGFTFKNQFNSTSEKEKYESEYSELYSTCQNLLYTGGYRIYTSIDMNKQNVLQNALDKNLNSFTEKDTNGIYKFQGSATCIDNSNGKVVAIVGGRSQDTSGYTLNRAFQSYRQPGSTFKPLVVYAPAFENLGYSASTIVNDVKEADGPKNYNSKYEGPITIRYAVEQSKNTVAWNLFKQVGVKKGLSYVVNMRFKNIVDTDYTLASALGGLTYGTNTLEMASAYSTLARGGSFYNPTCIVKITDADNNVIYNDSSTPVQIYNQNAAKKMTEILESVMDNGTGKKMKLSNMASAGKTGSTNDSKDGWFAGYTPYYSLVVWCGYDTPRSVSNLYGSTYPGYIWKDFMSEIHKNLPYKAFDTSKASNVSSEVSSQVKEEESKKVLIDEIDNLLSIYMNKEVNSLKDISSLESVHKELISKISNLTDESKKSAYNNIIADRKNFIESKKQVLSQENVNEPTDINNGEIESSVPPVNTGEDVTGGDDFESPESPESPESSESSEAPELHNQTTHSTEIISEAA